MVEKPETVALIDAFANPPLEYAPMPLWVWNGKMTRERISEVLEQFKERGIGGSFIHPRPSLITEYLSEEWFQLWKFALQESERLGMELHIYDENSYPSGFGGGHVPATDPGTQAENLMLEAQDGKPKIVRRQAAPDTWTAGFAYVDLARKRSTECFINLTHAQYEKHVGSALGKTIRYAFTDEPTLKCQEGFNVSRELYNRFRNDHGYDLEPVVEQLMDLGEQGAQTRFDYFRTLQRMFTDGFLKPLHDWCGMKGISFAGHFDEHAWPYPGSCPDSMASQRWMQCPGIDLLGFQFFPDKFENLPEPHRNLYLMTVKEVTSVGFQLGRERIICETTGGGGYDMHMAEFKALDDFVMTYGISLINPHLSHQTLAGARKFDWPHTYSDHSSWWDAYGELARSETRAAWATAVVRRSHRVLVLQPTLTGWLHYLPESFQSADPKGRLKQKLDELRESQPNLVGKLRDNQVDFDLGDELIMEELADIVGKRLRVGQCQYDVVVLPSGMEVMLGSTVHLLERFLDAGGVVLAVGDAPGFVDGRRDDRVVQVSQRHQKEWRKLESVDELCDAIRKLLPPAIKQLDGSPLPRGINHDSGVAPDGSQFHFLSNETEAEVTFDVLLETRCLEMWDSESGCIAELAQGSGDGKATCTITLEPWGASILRAADASAVVDEEPSFTGTGTDLDLKLQSVERKEPNILPLWYCDLDAGGRNFSDLHITTASDLAWRAHGFEKNPWEWAVQFRRNLVDRIFESESGYKQLFRFSLDPDVPRDTIFIGIERPWLYQIRVNGCQIDEKGGEPWFDEEFRRFPVGEALRPGWNELELSCAPMHPLAEVAPAYLMGDFSLRSAAHGFDLTPAKELALGPWQDQGAPFYHWGVAYRFSFQIANPSGRLELSMPSFLRNSAVAVSLDDELGGWIWKPPHTLSITRELTPGQHILELEVKGNLRNLLGPHFSKSLPVVWSWRKHPEGPASGDAYQFSPTGLVDLPVLKCF